MSNQSSTLHKIDWTGTYKIRFAFGHGVTLKPDHKSQTSIMTAAKHCDDINWIIYSAKSTKTSTSSVCINVFKSCEIKVKNCFHTRFIDLEF